MSSKVPKHWPMFDGLPVHSRSVVHITWLLHSLSPNVAFSFFLSFALACDTVTMASILKAQRNNSLNADVKGKGKRRRAEDMEGDEEAHVSAPAPKKPRNKQRVLLLSSRGITHRMRHLMNDLEVLLPHVKKGTLSQSTVTREKRLV